MGFQKTIPIGSAGQVDLSEAGGIATLKVSLAQAVGGGSMAGVAKASASVEVDVSAAQLIDAGFELAKAKFPSVALLIDEAKLLVDAELAKV